MSPPAAKQQRDELFVRLDRIEASLAGMREAMVRMEEAEKQARERAAEAVDRLDEHEDRLKALEALSNKAEGAKGLGKALWVAIAAIGAAVVTWFARAAR